MTTLRRILLTGWVLSLFTAPVNAQWVQTNGPYGGNIQSFAVSPAGDGTGGTNLFAGTYDGVFLSSDNGSSWTAVNSGLTYTSVQITDEIPLKFELEQNFPNPFNPVTNITFRLPSRSYVSLKVFDALGREVATLVSEALPGGTYSRQWDAAGVASGVYVYRLEAGSFIETRKLILLR